MVQFLRFGSNLMQMGWVCVSLMLVLVLSGCVQKTGTSEDILTQKMIASERTPITVLVKYAFSINAFEKTVEEKFPDIDIIQVGNYTRDMGIDEYRSRLEHDDLTDIVMTWPLDVGEQYWADRLLDLSGMAFTSRYSLFMLNDISRDGKLYYLPGPSQVRGIIYNKTLFKEKQWQVPKNFEEFVALCKTIEKSGMRSIQLGFENAEVLDTAFIGFNYGNYFAKPKDRQWLEQYNLGKGKFGDHFRPALALFQRMIDDGIWQASDLDISYSERENMLFTRQCAMVEDSVLMARMGYKQVGCTDEFALMPFFNPSEESDWARLYMVCYIGLNKHLADQGNQDKYALVMKLMDYISTPEGQNALAADTGAMFSGLIDMTPPDVVEIKLLMPALKHGRYAIFPQLKNAQQALRLGLAGMIQGKITAEMVIDMVDKQNLSPSAVLPPRKLANATADFTLIETGNFVTDTLRAFAQTDLALFLDNGKDGRYNGKGISGRFYQGDVTEADLNRVLPDLKHGEKGTLCIVKITGENLIKTLEHSIFVDNQQTGWFYYFSGLKMVYDPVAVPGTRIKSITLFNGSPIDLNRVYTVAVMDETMPVASLISSKDTGITISTVLRQALQKAGKISPQKDGRFMRPEENKK